MEGLPLAPAARRGRAWRGVGVGHRSWLVSSSCATVRRRAALGGRAVCGSRESFFDGVTTWALLRVEAGA